MTHASPIAAAFHHSVHVPAIRQRPEDGGAAVSSGSMPEDRAVHMREELERWVPMLRAAGAQPT